MARRADNTGDNDAGVTRVLNCKPSPARERDWTFDQAEAAGLAVAAAVPDACDRREAWWPVSNQHSSGACVGFALADGVLRWHFVQARRMRRSTELSTRFIWMASKETDTDTSFPETFLETAGTTLKSALDIARKFGCVDAGTLPFGTGALYRGEPETFFLKASRLKISGYVGLRTELAKWRAWIGRNGPLLARLDVDSAFDAGGRNGMLTRYGKRPRGGHAVAIVGYDRTGFIIRNSWGKGWGRNGFVHATDAYVAQAFTEAYGVVA